VCFATRECFGSGVDAAEPATANAGDGTFHVARVNHKAKQADVMLNLLSGIRTAKINVGLRSG
jgi:hypothetical protein